jgi:anti-sigma regulatory factor (Ser/Thr protein kinase)
MGKPLAEKQVGGLGIHLVREMMDELEYRRENDKNLLILKGKFGRASAWKSPKNEERMS